MDAIVFVPTIVVGSLLVVYYLIRCWRGTRVFSLSVVISIVLFTAGVITGALLIVRPFLSQPFVQRLVGLDLYIWLGGLSVLLVSAQAIFRDVFKR